MSLEHPHPEPRSYPLMLRTWNYAWWRPVSGLLALLVAMFIAAPLVLFPLLAATVALDHTGSYSEALKNAATLDPVTWQGLLYLNLSLAALVPATWLIVRVVHGMRPRWLMSVLPGIRWRFFFACLGLSVVAIAAQLTVGAFLPGDPNDLGTGVNDITRTLVAMLVVVAITTPIQAMGEEYAFRGYILQAVGSLTRQPWIAIVVSGFLFGLAHGVQNAPLFADRFSFGVLAAYLVYRTGGLEAGIALHIWNNIVAFGFALFLGNIDDTLNVTEVSWWNLPLTITQNGVYLLLVLTVAKRMGITSRTTPPVLPVTTPAV
ncbi:CPBP family intramembrane glutamic endopeptidase [Nocardioides marmorisolisilvae]|uniref:CPBP family intramembrane metalloprotease n=1 Tax=Nocardioides marmorisolisilvae TaxID=1542737 RepID=A0A3N0DWA4_9ACTN|nr:CPBP family intramembrane glutamic endopeptidase [Nocardioides marmorisolisilvae]RNL79889.1 CPBP family intramembrane metalloprotease [Nocardioides marmorisolisilvae]